MFEWRQAKRGGRFLSLSGALLLAAALALCAVQAAAAEEAVPDPKTAPCKGLKPVNNLDELLYQFYINLDSDCLFEMSTEELEKIWDIEIYSQGKYRLNSDYRQKSYGPEKDALIVGVYQSKGKNVRFKVNMTENYMSAHHTIFPDGEWPKLLPKPLRKYTDTKVGIFSVSRASTPVKIKPEYQGKYAYIDKYDYYWLNTDKTRMMILVGSESSVTSVSIFNSVDARYLNNDYEDRETDPQKPPLAEMPRPNKQFFAETPEPHWWIPATDNIPELYWDSSRSEPKRPYWEPPHE